MVRNRYYQGSRLEHFDGIRFLNPGEANADRTILDVVRWRLSGRRAQWPKVIEVEEAIPERVIGNLSITMIGHATVLIQAAGLNILTDPVWSERASPVKFAGPKRVTKPGVPFKDLPPIHAVLLSHNHYDHLDLDTLAQLQHAHAPLIVTPLGNDTIIRRHIPTAKVAAGDWEDQFELGQGTTVTIVPALHWSARGMSDRRMALWGGFILRTPSAGIYFAGDTGYGSGRTFHEMRQRHGPIDVALVPIGGYEPRWFMSAQHSDPEEAVQIALDLGVRHLIGIHWGTFNLTDEPCLDPARLLAEAAARRGSSLKSVAAAVPGQVWAF